MAKSPWRRATSRNAQRLPSAGNDTASISSSSERVVAIIPAKKSCASTRRRRLALRRCTSPPSARSTTGLVNAVAPFAVSKTIFHPASACAGNKPPAESVMVPIVDANSDSATEAKTEGVQA